MENEQNSKRVKSIGIKFIVILVCTVFVYILTLYVLTQLKKEEPGPSFDYMTQHPGTYATQQKIGGIALSETVIHINSKGEMTCSNRMYPIQALLPLVITFLIVVSILGVGILATKKTKNKEI